jgi:putative copper export protein
VLSPTASTVRLFLHVMAATIWVGGQFALAGVVPVLRRQAPDTTKAVARAFAKVAWPAFAVLVITGIWNLVEIDITDTSTAYQATVFAKVALAMIAAAAVAVHSIGTSKLALALGGAIGALASVAALFLGVLLRTGG